MSYFIIFICLFLMSVALAYVFKRSFGQTAVIANMLMIFVLYVCGLFARLDIGGYFFVALCCAMTVLTVVLVIKKKDYALILNVIKNPLTIFYFCIGITLGAAFFDKVSFDYDELSHWALVVKNMIAYDNFGNLGNSTTMFNQYVPASGLFMYGFQIFNKEFVNGNLCAAFNILMLSMLFPILEKFNNKLSWQCLVALVAVIVTPMLFKMNVYINILVDSLLGINLAYIYCAYLMDRGKADAFTMLGIGLGCFVITLTKSSGLAMAAFAIVFIAVDVLTRGRKGIKPFFKNKINIVMALLPVVLIIFAKVSWSQYIVQNNVRAGWDSSEMTLQSILAYITAPNEFQSQVTDTFLKRFFIGSFRYEYNVYLQQPHIFTICVIAAVSVLIYIKAEKKSFAITQGIMMIVLLLGYGVVMLFMYVFSFSYGESLRLASYPRYFQTYTVGIALIFLYQLIDMYLVPMSEKQSEKTKNKKNAKLTWLVPASALVILCVLGGIFGNIELRKISEPYLDRFSAWRSTVAELDENDSVYYVMLGYDEQREDVKDYLWIRYFSTPTQCSGFQEGGSYADGRGAKFAYTGNPFYMKELSKEDFAKETAQYEYLYLDDVNDAFIEKYGELFDGEIKKEILYEVKHVEDGIKFFAKN